MTVRPEDSDRTADSPHSLTESLRRWSDVELVTALRHRPDLALPAPVDIASLASRAGVRTSVSRSLDGLDAFTLRVLEVICCLAENASPDQLRSWFAATDARAVDDAVAGLTERILIWYDGAYLHAVGAVRELLGAYPAGLGRDAATLFGSVNDLVLARLLRTLELPPATQPRSGAEAAEAVTTRLAELIARTDETQRAILHRLAAGPPVGTLRNAADRDVSPTGAPTADAPARALTAIGLIVPIDRDTVELPREIALHLRDVPAGDVRPAPPPLDMTERGAAVIDGGGATAVLETVRLAALMLDTLAWDPAVQLRSGGMGVRDLRRLARVLDSTEQVTSLLIEITFDAGLLSYSTNADPTYLPSTEFDAWLRRGTAERWTELASAWLSMTRLPSLVGERDDRDKTIAPLSADVERHSAPTLRRQLLGLLAALPPGSTPSSATALLDRLAWRAPRRASSNRAAAAAMLDEAALLGITSYGAITGYARALLDGAESGAAWAEANAVDLLNAALPEPVAEFLLQPDLTAVVPGPPTAELQAELTLAADLESAGGASVYRITPASLRRALDAGRSGSDLLQFFSSRSRTPVPQALQYLINDVATQHGRLRTGAAISYLRCDDEALLDRVLAEPELLPLGLQRIAPTVIVSNSGLAVVLDKLRAAGFAPAAESADGAIVTLSNDAPRVPGRPHSRISRVRSSGIPDGQLAQVVTRLRASEKLSMAVTRSASRVSQQIPGVTSASILELLRSAIRNEQTIALAYVDDTGTPSQRTLLPISMGGGVVRGHEPDDGRLHSYPLQRITTVSLLDD
ncbi:MAG: hypothetical protein JWN95_2775 [Frankiales bacterium]|nr:hypothetical protein [Frankiales bacterium]